MNSTLSDKSIRSFLRNPIGLLGLLAFLFDSIIGLVLSIGMDKLTNASERLPMIWFLICYPVLVLILFAFLAIFRPRHLYSPQDYGTGDSFIKATENQTQKRIEKEVEEMLKDEESSENTNNMTTDEDKHSDNKTSNNKHTLIKQKHDRNNLTFRLIEAERIGLKAAEKQLNIPITPNVIFSNDGRHEIEIDGFNQTNGVFTIVEVKLVKSHSWKMNVRMGIITLRKIIEYINRDGRVIQPVLVIVTPYDENGRDIQQFCHRIDPLINCIVAKDPELIEDNTESD